MYGLGGFDAVPVPLLGSGSISPRKVRDLLACSALERPFLLRESRSHGGTVTFFVGAVTGLIITWLVKRAALLGFRLCPVPSQRLRCGAAQRQGREQTELHPLGSALCYTHTLRRRLNHPLPN